MMNDENIYSESECIVLLNKTIKGYSEFIKAYCPHGWRKSECVKFFHPIAEQQLEEHKRIAENLKRFSKNRSDAKAVSLSEFEQDLSDVDEENEPRTLLGLCLWDIFSNNHSVKDAQGKEYDLGSFRGCASMIAELLNGAKDNNDSINFDYVDFYMGTIWIDSRGDLQPFYEYIFSVLKQEGCDWEYNFPRMGLINFNKEETIKPEDYNPEKALAIEMENKKVEEFQKELDRIHDEEYEEAKYKKPSATVLAYEKIYGDLPDGHPQKNL
nr:hypothetical protein [Bacteroidota bacterium]